MGMRAFIGACFIVIVMAMAALGGPIGVASGAPFPYVEGADAKAEIRQALAAARASRVPVLVIFGANWCEDCRALDAALSTGKSAELIAQAFKVVKVDVGNFNHNLDVAAMYGNPIKRGIPAVVVLSPANQVLYASRAGELANARRMSEQGIYEFFKRAAKTGKTRQ
jgi:thioredoxin 1